jgi:hypothetical protein
MNNDFHSQSELWAFDGNLIGVLALERFGIATLVQTILMKPCKLIEYRVKRIQSSSLTESASLCLLKTPVSSDLLTVLETS